jgi:hypothetical protein
MQAVETPDQHQVRGLSEGDRFVVSVEIHKETEVRVDGHASNSVTTDRFRIEYQVLQALDEEDTVLVATLQEVSREEPLQSEGQTARQTVGVASDLSVAFRMSERTGQLTLLPPARATIVSQFADGNSWAEAGLKLSCPDSLIESWLARPFWLMASPADVEAGSSWTRQTDESMGPFGVLRCERTLTLKEVDEGVGQVTLTNTSHFKPLVLPSDSGASGQQFLEGLTAEMMEYSGRATMYPGSGTTSPSPAREPPELELMPESEEPEIATRVWRPQFESLQESFEIAGSARRLEQDSVLTDGSTGETGDPDGQEVRFRQRQRQVWTLVEAARSNRRYLFDQSVPVIPAR